MSKYRKIESKIWNDEKFNTLSDNAKLLFFFLLTHPHLTALGAMRGSARGLADELGWQEKAFREAFREAFRKGMLKASEKACFIWLPNFLKYNKPESPNVIKSWDRWLDYLPECDLKIELIQHVKAFAEGLGEAFAKALPKAFRKAMANHEHEHEHEHDSIITCSEHKISSKFELKLKNGLTHSIVENDLLYFKEHYPFVNINSEFKKMEGWLDSNSRKRKTPAGINRFINAWLARASKQDAQSSARNVILDFTNDAFEQLSTLSADQCQSNEKR